MGGHGRPWVAMGGHGPHGRWVTLNGHPAMAGHPAMTGHPAMRPWPLFNEMAAFLKKKKAAIPPRTVHFFKSGHVAGWPDGRWVTPLPTFCRAPRVNMTFYRVKSYTLVCNRCVITSINVILVITYS